MSGAWSRIAFAALLFATAVWLVHDRERRAPERLARDLARPLLLPALWTELDEAERRGDLAAAAALGRDVLRYLPDWTDGHIHFAARLAFDLGGRTSSTAEALACLDAALVWLQEAADASADPARASRLAAAQALFVEARAAHDPELADALEARAGRAPSEIALEFLDRAIAATPGSRTLRERRAFLLVQVVAAAIRTGDLERALETLDVAIRLLGKVEDPEASIPWVRALRRVRPALEGNHAILDELATDPYLEEIVEALRRR